MNCAEVRDRLPGLLYGDLEAAEAAEVQKHRAGCPACQTEFANLQRVRSALDAVPAPPVRVDLSQIYAQAARLQQKQVRRWRRATVVLLGAAAALLLVLGLKLEVRLEASQLTVRWGSPPEVAKPEVPPDDVPVARQIEPPSPSITAEEFQLMKDLIHALAANEDTRDRRWQEEAATLQARLEGLQSRSLRLDRLVAALYIALFGSRDKGEKP